MMTAQQTTRDRPLLGLTVLVTGSSSRIGAAIVKQVAVEGARPIVHYSRDGAWAARLLEQIEGRLVRTIRGAAGCSLKEPSGQRGQ